MFLSQDELLPDRVQKILEPERFKAYTQIAFEGVKKKPKKEKKKRRSSYKPLVV